MSAGGCSDFCLGIGDPVGAIPFKAVCVACAAS